MGPRHRALAALVLGGSCTFAAAAEGPGLTVNSDDLQWPRLQGRVALQPAPTLGGSIAGSRSAPSANSLGVMGDYYVTPSFLGPTRAGGFRATSGLLMGSRGSTWAVPSPSLGTSTGSRERTLFGAQGTTLVPGDTSGDNQTVPYLGVGYTGLSVRGGWSFSADLGLSLNAGSAVKLGRVFTGSQSLDDAVRDMRWSPLVQLGVSYSF
jgi:hypothetical protein